MVTDIFILHGKKTSSGKHRAGDVAAHAARTLQNSTWASARTPGNILRSRDLLDTKHVTSNAVLSLLLKKRDCQVRLCLMFGTWSSELRVPGCRVVSLCGIAHWDVRRDLTHGAPNAVRGIWFNYPQGLVLLCQEGTRVFRTSQNS